MNFEEAKAWFASHRVGNETAEQTYSRLRSIQNSRLFFESNDAAIDAVRTHRPEAAARMDPMAFIQQFAYTRPTAATVSTNSRSLDLPVDIATPSSSRSQAEKSGEKGAAARIDPMAFIQQFAYTRPTAATVSSNRRSLDLPVDIAIPSSSRTPTEREQRLATAAAAKKRSRSMETFEIREARRRIDARSHSQHRSEETAEARTDRLRTVAISMSQHRSEETAEARADRLRTVAISMSQHRSEETAEARADRLRTVAISMSQHRSEETAEARADRLRTVAISMSQHRSEETAEARADRLRTVAISMSQHRSEETAEARADRLRTVVISMSQHRSEETAEARADRLRTVTISMSQHRSEETAEARADRLRTVAISMSQHRSEETAEARADRLRTVAISMSQHRAERTDELRNETQDIFSRANFDEGAVTPHYLGPMNVKCQFCGSYNFKDEEPADKKFTKCCQKGKLIIPKPVINGVEQYYPAFLRDLLSNPRHPHYRNFREHIRSYNSSVSFASFGANLMNVPGRGPYVFKVLGQTYHLSSRTEPRNENERSYAQLYVIDSMTQAVQTRMNHPAMTDCLPEILRQIHEFFRQNNSIARSYQLMREVQTAQQRIDAAQNLSIPLVQMAMRTDRQSDERRFNLPTANEVAMIFVNEDGEPPFDRDIRIYPRNPDEPNRALFRLNIRNCNLDPMVYSILFPYGQPGWHPEYRCNGRHFSMLQHKSALMAIRDEFSPIMAAGKLTQQWLVDSYLQVEAHNLEYVRFNQSNIRSELYQGLADYVNTRAAEAGVTAGRPVILPRRLLASDEEFDRFLSEASNLQMPYPLRHSFAYLYIFCHPQNARILFNKYTDDFILDLERQHPRDAAINLALHQIQAVFNEHGTRCSDFGLPTPTGTYAEALNYDQTVERDKAARLIPTLNPEQRTAFDRIVQGINNPSSNKLFYLNGPGGSGKTYLYKTLISYVRGCGEIFKAYASTGIAATLMDDGSTIHSGFGLPVPMLETSTSRILGHSEAGKELRIASLLILDEITMLNKEGLRIIDKLLREEIMKNNLPFGGKVVVIGGDFRQTLPIVLHGNKVDTIESTIIKSDLWKKFHQISLITNMRSAGQALHNQWLLDIGSGTTESIVGLSENAVEIPSAMITQEDIIQATFGSDVRNLTVDQLSTRVILATRNEVTLSINNSIIDQLDGELVTYTSADSIITDDENTERIYPVEFLNAQTPSGMPPHKICLKLGAVVMLLRNLNRKKGLCNGTRLIVRGLHEHFIICEIISENHKGDTVFISRIDITPSETTLPFKMKRRQFPIIPAFAITINKSQGQSYDIVGVLLDEPVFGHGQLYVALSRCRNANNIKISIVEGRKQGRLLNDNRYFTEKVVYKEIFRSVS